MQSPITIVIPVYNRAHTIALTLDSIDAQSTPPAHLILVDNNSTDGSLDILRSRASGRDDITVLSEKIPGACAARNRGLREVKTEWTMFFDSDDIMHPGHIRDFTNAISQHPRADIIGRDIASRTIDGRSRRLYFKDGPNAMSHHIFRGCLSTQRFIARTYLFRKTGAWDESLAGWDDFELGVRLLLENPDIVDIKGSPSVTVFQQTESITGLDFSSRPDRWERSLNTIRGHFLSMPDSDIRKHRFLDWLDSRAMILAAQYEREARDVKNDPSYCENAHTLAQRLHDEVISRTKHPHKQHLIYLHNLRFNRLSWILARLLL